jgi:hypothetical protein
MLGCHLENIAGRSSPWRRRKRDGGGPGRATTATGDSDLTKLIGDSEKYQYSLPSAPGLRGHAERASAGAEVNPIFAVLSGISLFAQSRYLSQPDSIAAIEENADMGHLASQILLGYAYQLGVWVGIRSATAVSRLRRAAMQAPDVTQYALAKMYVSGTWITEDDQTALQLFTTAVEQGITLAQYEFGPMHETGRATMQDYGQAASPKANITRSQMAFWRGTAS